MLQSLISHASSLCYTLALTPSLKDHGVNPLQTTSLIHRDPLLSRSTALRISRTQEECERSSCARVKEGESNEASPSLQGPDINHINYGAATVSNPWRGNEKIRGRSQLNTEQVNEIINYLIIYWESGGPTTAPTFTYLSLSQGPYHREHLL